MNLRVLSIAVTVAIGMLGLVQVADPASLGISAVTARWLAIVGAGLGILSGFLPRVQGPTTDPDTLIDRIEGLPVADQRHIAKTLADREIRERAEELRQRFPGGPVAP